MCMLIPCTLPRRPCVCCRWTGARAAHAVAHAVTHAFWRSGAPASLPACLPACQPAGPSVRGGASCPSQVVHQELRQRLRHLPAPLGVVHAAAQPPPPPSTARHTATRSVSTDARPVSHGPSFSLPPPPPSLPLSVCVCGGGGSLEVVGGIGVDGPAVVGRQAKLSGGADAVCALLLERDEVQLRGGVVRHHRVVVVCGRAGRAGRRAGRRHTAGEWAPNLREAAQAAQAAQAAAQATRSPRWQHSRADIEYRGRSVCPLSHRSTTHTAPRSRRPRYRRARPARGTSPGAWRSAPGAPCRSSRSRPAGSLYTAVTTHARTRRTGVGPRPLEHTKAEAA
jgi:hypothetical protein